MLRCLRSGTINPKLENIPKPLGFFQGDDIVFVNRTGVIHVPYICTLYVHT